jgi:hypothetical protein
VFKIIMDELYFLDASMVTFRKEDVQLAMVATLG